VQYQFVLPLESKQGLVAILKKISDAGLGSFLAVLKVFGKQDDLISFPMEGYTLALDFPVRDGLFASWTNWMRLCCNTMAASICRKTHV
jgi:decaprenylphospho-beta-D-ribofuranose 2-oxidase